MATSRLNLPTPSGTDEVSTGDNNISAISNALDNAALYRHGNFVDRPAQPTLAGTYFYADDTKILYLSDGATWRTISDTSTLRTYSIVNSPGTITSTGWVEPTTPVSISIFVPANGIVSIMARVTCKAVTTLNVGKMALFSRQNGGTWRMPDVAAGDIGAFADDVVSPLGQATSGYDLIISQMDPGTGSMWTGYGWETAPNSASGSAPLATWIPQRGYGAMSNSTVDYSLNFQVTSASLLLGKCELYAKVETF